MPAATSNCWRNHRRIATARATDMIVATGGWTELPFTYSQLPTNLIVVVLSGSRRREALMKQPGETTIPLPAEPATIGIKLGQLAQVPFRVSD